LRQRLLPPRCIDAKFDRSIEVETNITLVPVFVENRRRPSRRKGTKDGNSEVGKILSDGTGVEVKRRSSSDGR
jgi:hypothetical protein